MTRAPNARRLSPRSRGCVNREVQAAARAAAALGSESQADGASRSTFEPAVHGTGVAHEVGTSPRVPGKELMGQHVALESITSGARGHEVAGDVRPTAGQRMHVVEGSGIRSKRGGAVDAAPHAVAERRGAQGPLAIADSPAVGRAEPPLHPVAADQGIPGETTSWHCTSRERQTPRLERELGRGVCR